MTTAATDYEISARKRIGLAVAELKLKRTTHESFWRDVDEHICPGLYRGQLSDTDRGQRKDDAILDSTPHQAWLVHKAGFLTHVTSPVQRWIRVKIDDLDRAEYGPIATWLDDVSRWMLEKAEESGTYDALESMYGNRAGFGSACLWIDRRRETLIFPRNLAMGSFWVGLDAWNEINVLYREFRMNVKSYVDWFAHSKAEWSKISTRIKTAYDQSRYLENVDVGHYVSPNPDWNPKYVSAREKRFKSCYFELGNPGGGTSEKDQTIVSESGFDEFPALFCPWDAIGEDTYGYSSPGRTVIGDCKELQYNEEQITKGVALALDPPTYGSAFWGQGQKKIGYLPGQFTPIPAENMQAGGIKQLHDFTPQVLQMDVRQDAKRKRIERGFHVDIFRMLDYLQERTRTATEIAARNDERFRQLIGATNRLNRRGLGPLARRMFQYGMEEWLMDPQSSDFPPIPDDLRGQTIKIEFVSTMQAAMRALDITPIERVLGIAGQIAPYYPQITDKLDLDQCIDEAAKGAGAPARIIHDDESVAEVRSQRAQQQAAQQQADMMAQMGKTARDLGNVKTDEPNALMALANGVTQAVKGAA